MQLLNYLTNINTSNSTLISNKASSHLSRFILTCTLSVSKLEFQAQSQITFYMNCCSAGFMINEWCQDRIQVQAIMIKVIMKQKTKLSRLLIHPMKCWNSFQHSMSFKTASEKITQILITLRVYSIGKWILMMMSTCASQ
ncbi:hypothetical protein FGO68_gene4727 [Halteria grandinella]|uniref:Uncharacterized protein n=1 Tax=Halteria grandinella TaxID=5974 RepID=A0A8J8NEP4_HALGN|nr:hypothetical protein FGO68_gene4727 [Halteria grandinella]